MEEGLVSVGTVPGTQFMSPMGQAASRGHQGNWPLQGHSAMWQNVPSNGLQWDMDRANALLSAGRLWGQPRAQRVTASQT